MSTAAPQRRFASALAGMLVGLAVTAPAVKASTLATLELSTNRARAGEEVSFKGWYYNDVNPVRIRWQTVDGPVLATVTPESFGMVHNHWRSIAGSLRIPPDAPPGTHLLLATQDFAPPAKITFGVPARAEIQIGDAPGPRSARTPDGGRRPSTITVTEAPHRSELLAAVVVGAALAALLALVAVVLPARRSRVSP